MNFDGLPTPRVCGAAMGGRTRDGEVGGCRSRQWVRRCAADDLGGAGAVWRRACAGRSSGGRFRRAFAPGCRKRGRQVVGGEVGEQGGEGAQRAHEGVDPRGDEAAQEAEAASPAEEGGQEGIDAGADILCGFGGRLGPGGNAGQGLC